MTAAPNTVIEALLSIEPTAGILVVDQHGRVVSEYGKAKAILGGSSVGRNVDEMSGLRDGVHSEYRTAFLADPSSRPMRARSPIVVRRLGDGAAIEVQIGLVPLANGHTAALFQRPKGSNLAAGAPAGVPLPVTADTSGRVEVTPTIREWMAETTKVLEGIRDDLHDLATAAKLGEQRSSTIERDIHAIAERIGKTEAGLTTVGTRLAVLEDRADTTRRSSAAVGGGVAAAVATAAEILRRLFE